MRHPRPTQPDARPNERAVSTRIIVHGEPNVAVRIARDHPDATVLLLARDWPAVDRARDTAHAAGVADRVSVRHQSAAAALGLLPWLGPTSIAVTHRTPRLLAGGARGGRA